MFIVDTTKLGICLDHTDTHKLGYILDLTYTSLVLWTTQIPQAWYVCGPKHTKLGTLSTQINTSLYVLETYTSLVCFGYQACVFPKHTKLVCVCVVQNIPSLCLSVWITQINQACVCLCGPRQYQAWCVLDHTVNLVWFQNIPSLCVSVWSKTYTSLCGPHRHTKLGLSV